MSITLHRISRARQSDHNGGRNKQPPDWPGAVVFTVQLTTDDLRQFSVVISVRRQPPVTDELADVFIFRHGDEARAIVLRVLENEVVNLLICIEPTRAVVHGWSDLPAFVERSQKLQVAWVGSPSVGRFSKYHPRVLVITHKSG